MIETTKGTKENDGSTHAGNHGEVTPLSWLMNDGVIELALHRPPCNELGSDSLKALESFATFVQLHQDDAHALIIYSEMSPGFCAGADLRELYHRSRSLEKTAALSGVRDFLERIHRVLNLIDATPLTTIAAVHGVTFGGGFELALTCDLINADKMARFCFPELRLGLVPGFGGIPRLKRDVSNGVVRDLLLTGRSINATKALDIGLASQLAAEGEALHVARATAAQVTKFDRGASAAAKQFIKPLPAEELRREIDIFCRLFPQPAVIQGLHKFVEEKSPYPYLP